MMLHTRRWYASPGCWVDEASAGHEFSTVEEAIDFARALEVAGVTAVLHYEDPACDLELPVKAAI